jgi:hypothetical protein
MQTGIMLTTPGGTKYWHPCKDAETGLREMASQAFVYGTAWDDKRTVKEFGTSDGKTFTPAKGE